jgi:hypothetical protein
MMDEIQQYSYQSFIIGKWFEIYELGEEYRNAYLSGEIDFKITNLYISKLTRLWGDLWVKIEGRHDLKMTDGTLLRNEFEKYKCYYFDPEQIMPMTIEEAKQKADLIYKMEQMLNVALEALNMTAWAVIQ